MVSREEPPRRRGLLGLLQALAFVAYPFAIYYAHTRLGTRAVGIALILLLLAVFLIRLRGALDQLAGLVVQHLGLVVLVALATLLNQRMYLLLLPALLSLYMLGTFGASLRKGPPMIERFARIVEEDLPEFTLPYCLRVTQIWCVFFAFNIFVVCLLALLAPLSWWAIYTGVIFYVLLGLLVGGEVLYRKLAFRYYADGPLDRLLSGYFPAEDTARGRRSLEYLARRNAKS